MDAVTAVGMINDDPSMPLTMLGDPGKGTWFLTVCPGGKSLVFSGPNQPPPAAVSPGTLAQQALASMQLPAPAFGTNPPVGGPGNSMPIVNLPTLFWANPAAWKPLSVTASAGGVSATATAVPQELVVDPGDDTGAISCSGPGRAYDPNLPIQSQVQCAHTYTWSSAGQPGNAYTLRAHVLFRVTWRANTGQGGDFGLVPGQTLSMALPVGEVQSIQVGSTS